MTSKVGIRIKQKQHVNEQSDYSQNEQQVIVNDDLLPMNSPPSL